MFLAVQRLRFDIFALDFPYLPLSFKLTNPQLTILLIPIKLDKINIL
jgi:hypothetical protein